MNIIQTIADILGTIAHPIANACRSVSPSVFRFMGNDFSSWLLMLSVFTGIVVLLEFMVLRKRRHAKGSDKRGSFVENCVGYFPIILAIFLLRAFVVEPFRIPSGSMLPTLLVGDFILVNRAAYGLRCPVGDCTLVETGTPKRGDVVVFRFPLDTSQDFIKRVVGLPGDHIVMKNTQVFINEKPLKQTADGEFVIEEPARNSSGEIVVRTETTKRFTEDMGAVQHAILEAPDKSRPDYDYTVPEGEYFMMGDNRDHSMDSRFWSSVPEANLKGKAVRIWLSWDDIKRRIRWDRFGDAIP